MLLLWSNLKKKKQIHLCILPTLIVKCKYHKFKLIVICHYNCEQGVIENVNYFGRSCILYNFLCSNVNTLFWVLVVSELHKLYFIIVFHHFEQLYKTM